MMNKPDAKHIELSRDFALLTTIILILLGLFAVWVVLDSYKRHSNDIARHMQVQASHVDHMLNLEIERAGHVLESMARQIAHIGPEKHKDIAALLRSFDREGAGINLFAWADAQQDIRISSQEGILPVPLNIADRDYMKKSMVDPWKVQVGRPIYGRLSGKDVVPVSLGVIDVHGQFRGTLLASLNIQQLKQDLRQTLQPNELDFSVITTGLIPVLHEVHDNNIPDDLFPSLITQKLSMAPGAERADRYGRTIEGYLTHIRTSKTLPFVYLMSYDLKHQRLDFLATLWQRLLPVLLFIVFLAAILWLVRHRLLAPLHTLKAKIHALQRGEVIAASNMLALPEVRMIDEELIHTSEFIQERRRIEHEQKHKLALMKQAKEAAEVSNRVKLNFMNSMSHELRTPLNTISGFSELMKDEVYGTIENDHYRQYVEDIYQSASLLQSLINDVIALGKAESDMMDLHEKPVQVHTVIAKCIRVLTDRLKESNITVENRASDQIPRLQVDELRLKQIILNLLTNSISHTPRGGSIVVDARCIHEEGSETRFEIVITDYGTQSPTEHQNSGQSVVEQLDEDGKPLPRKRSEIGQTSNLGVPLTRALVAMHQGELEIHTPSGSKATKITVRFCKERIVN